jgi:hypothetical protein
VRSQGEGPLKQPRKRLTYANLTSTLALFIALGAGSALAAGQLAPKSVGERQLRPGAVTAEKIRKEAVTPPKLKAGAVKNGKLAGGAVTTAKLAAGSVNVEKLAAGAVTGEKIAPDSVSGSQVIESTLGQVPSANIANSATFAESANPAAFAAVDQEGGVDASLAKGQISVHQGAEAGIWCITVPGLSPRGAQVTPRYNGSGAVSAFVTIGGTGSCPAPQVEVQTFSAGSRVKEPFYVVAYR